MRFKYLFLGVLAIIWVVFLLYRTNTGSSVDPEKSQNRASFGGASLSIEFATTTVARERGLGGRTSLPKDYGMLFEFVKDDFYGFWMKDTLVPLDMFWLDSKGQVVHIEADVRPSSYPHVFYPPVPARYVLETAAGFAKEYSIATGTPLDLQKFEPVSE